MDRLTRYLLELLLLCVIAGAVLVLVLRYHVLPEIERYHDRIAAAASRAVGLPLSIGKIEADWEGLRPRLSFTDVKIFDAQGAVVLSLPKVSNTVAWSSLPMLELRFHSLIIDRPELAIRRDAEGKLYVAGIALDGESGADGDSADWILHQSHVIVRDGQLSWQDEFRGAPDLALQHVDIRIENWFGTHRVALNASPPQALSARLDVRGSFEGDSLAGIADWDGELFANLEYADVSAWRAWVDLPPFFQRGKGALRMWLELEQGELRRVDADLALAGVKARFADDLPLLDLKELRGHVGWHDLERGIEIESTRLSLQLREGVRVKPTDFYLRMVGQGDEADSSGEIRANTLDLAEIATLAKYLPFDAELKRQMAQAAPQGSVSGLDLSWRRRANGSLRYQVQGRVDELAVQRVNGWPGFSHLSGKVEGDDQSGTVWVSSPHFALDAPRVFAAPLQFDTLNARIGWQRNARGMEVKLGSVEIANADLAGTLYGSYQMEAEGPGFMDATVDMKRLAVEQAAHYTPLPAVGQKVHGWLRSALLGGEIEQFRVRIRGDLREFPFVGNRNGMFRLEARARAVTMEFAEDWPKLEDAATHLLIEGNKLKITAATARSAGAALSNVQVEIPNLMTSAPLLQIRGESLDTTQRCLDYIAHSPVNGYLGGLTEGVRASGSGRLGLQIDVPLGGSDPVKVRGEYHFSGNDVDFAPYVPMLNNVEGALLFTESSVHAGDIRMQVFGGPAYLTVQGKGAEVQVAAHGKLDLDAYSAPEPLPVLQHVHGATEWKAEIASAHRELRVTVDSDLQGITSTLPAPLDKVAKENVPVHYEQKWRGGRHSVLQLRYGKLLDAEVVQERQQDGSWQVARGLLTFGGAPRSARSEGLWIVGTLPHLALQGWNAVALPGPSGGTLPDIDGIDLMLDQVSGFGNAAQALSIKGSGRNGLLSLRLASREVAGDLIWQPQGNGKLLGRFQHVLLGEGGPSQEPVELSERRAGKVDNSGFPVIDLAVEKLSYKGRALGRLEVEVEPDERDVRLNRLRLTNPDGLLEMTGKWQAEPEQTRINTRIEIADSGRLLSRYGYPDSVKDGGGTLESDLYWVGAPGDFDNARLNGSLRLKIGKGRFLKVDAGAAKLLGVLNLQAIPRRIALDFTDVISEGFLFDSITGNVQVINGLMMSSDMLLSGPTAKVSMKGQVDLNHSTQDLKVRILPALGDNVTLLSFMAGPTVGLGVLLTNKILSDPLDKLVAFDYNVTGSWVDPKVEKVGSRK